MKKTLLKLTLLLCALVVGSSAWADDEVYSTCLFGIGHGVNNNYTSTWETTNGDFTWSVSNGNTNYVAKNSTSWAYVKFGRKSNASIGSITTSASYPVAITKVNVTIDAVTTSNINSIKLYTKTNSTDWAEAGSYTIGTGTKSVSLESPSNDLYYKIEFDCASGSSNGLVQVSKVEFYYNPDTPTTYSVTYNANGATSGTVPTDASAYSSGTTVTVFGNTGSLAKTGYIFGGWNTQADGNGTNYTAGGTFSITAATTLYAKWNAKTITGLSYTGTPTKTTYQGGESFAPAGLTVTATYNDESQEDVTSSVTWTPNPLTAGTTFVTGTYMGQTVIVNGLTVTSAPGSDAEHAYTVAQARDAIDNNGNVTGVYVAGIVSQVDSYNSTYKSITYWISDNGTTTNQFEVYGGLSFEGGTAFSSKDDIQVGDVVVVKGNITYYSKNNVYEFNTNSNLVSQKLVAPTFYPAAGAVGSGTELTISDAHTDATIYYTTDGSTPTTSSTVYNSSSKPTITAATTFKAIAVKSGCENSEVASASYTLLTPVVTPVITLAGGTYTSAQSTTITCDTEGATIYYTTNGSAPTTSSTVYNGAISINESMTIKAIAAKDGMANSAVAETTYTISIPAINASNVNIAGAATEGSIAYTIDNPAGGMLTASVPAGSWVTLGADNESAIAFTCTVNSSETDARTTTVTLTYTYDTNKTVTKDVTVTQAKYQAPIAPAVAGVGAFVKVTDNDDLTSGTYLIVYEGDETHDAVAFDGSRTTLDASSNGIKVNIIDDKIESCAATAAATFEIRPSSGTIYSKSGKYIGNTGNSNALNASDNELTNTFDIPTTSNTNNNVDIVSSGGAYLRYNYASNQLRFRYFKSSTYTDQQAIALYKYDATETPFSTVVVGAAGYATFRTSTDVTFENNQDVTAYVVSAIKETSVTLTTITEAPMNTPVVIKAAQNTYSFGHKANATLGGVTNYLRVSDGTVTGGDDIYALSKSDDVVGFNQVSNTVTIPAGKCYLDTTGSGVKSFLSFSFDEDVVTGIEDVRSKMEDVRGEYYDLQGRRVETPTHGLYIINGKKVFVK